MSLPLICLKVGEKAYLEGLSKGMSKRFVFEKIIEALNDFGGGEEIRKERERKEKKEGAKVMVECDFV